ncbi:MAG: J domain-containing protein [Rariglobus sp.]
MPWPSRSASRRSDEQQDASRASQSHSRALVLIDSRPLQHAAWSQIHAARKLAEKASRDLRRHEETDTVAYERWLYTTFPQLVTSLRELHQQVAAKAYDIEVVQYMAAVTGRSLKKLWREHQEAQADPDTSGPDDEAPPDPDASTRHRPIEDDDDWSRDETTDHDDRPDNDASSTASARSLHRAPPASTEARDLYRRLVQQLHPDRGGEWTPGRERLWHEVQQAWDARDTDWLSRLEIDWEAANNTLSPDSSLSRLRRALIELHAARRDAERKLRAYRQSPAWRFTLSEKKRPHLHRRLETELRADLIALQRQLAYLNQTITAWESPRTRAGKERQRRH